MAQCRSSPIDRYGKIIMRMYEYTYVDGTPAAINLAQVIAMRQDGDGVEVTLGSMEMMTVRIPNKSLNDLLCVIEDYSDTRR